jgi:ANTAR domain/GAF domain
MDRSSAMDGLARLSGLLVRASDPLGVAALGLVEACATVSADAGGVLVRAGGGGGLEMLAATSHRVADLEAYQAGSEAGPCVESMRSRRPLHVGSTAEANQRWPGFGDRMESAGYRCAHAIPMSWQGEGIGGLNLFWQTAVRIDASDEVVLQMFADILTVAVVNVRPVPGPDAVARLREALDVRSTIEQAKGVLAYQRDLDMGEAYAALLRLSEEHRVTIIEAAAAVIEGARRGHPL